MDFQESPWRAGLSHTAGETGSGTLEGTSLPLARRFGCAERPRFLPAVASSLRVQQGFSAGAEPALGPQSRLPPGPQFPRCFQEPESQGRAGLPVRERRLPTRAGCFLGNPSLPGVDRGGSQGAAPGWQLLQDGIRKPQAAGGHSLRFAFHMLTAQSRPVTPAGHECLTGTMHHSDKVFG